MVIWCSYNRPYQSGFASPAPLNSLRSSSMVSLNKAIFIVASILLAQAVLFPYLLFKPSPAGLALNIYLTLGVIILSVGLISAAVNQQSEGRALQIVIDSM